MGRQVLRGKWIHTGRIDADQLDAVPVQRLHQLRAEGGEVLLELLRVGIGAGSQEHTLGDDWSGERGRRETLAPGRWDPHHLARAEVIIQIPFMDSWGSRTVVT